MAKQDSLIKIIGKMDDRSFYHTRNGGYQVRKINPNMSERVKTEETFLNTRHNAAEFGAAGSTAAASMRLMENKYQYILTPKMVGLLTKHIYRLSQTDTAHTWGQRSLPAPYFSSVQAKFNNLLKNPMPGLISHFMEQGIYYSLLGQTIVVPNTLTTTITFEQYWMSKGADGCYLSKYCYQVNPASWDTDLQQFALAECQIEDISAGSSFVDFTGESGHTLIVAGTITPSVVPYNAHSRMSGLLIVFQPYKKVGGDRQILSALCSAYWCSLQSQ